MIGHLRRDQKAIIGRVNDFRNENQRNVAMIPVNTLYEDVLRASVQ